MNDETKTIKLNRCLKAVMTILLVLGMHGEANASLFSEAAKLAGRGAARVAEKVGIKSAAKVAVKGGAEFAAARANWIAAKARKASLGLNRGQILSIGTATALTVGAHEVADGMQSACKDVGRALAGNPGKAALVAGGLTWPVGIAWALMVLVGGGLVVWMFFPLVSALRTRWAIPRRGDAVVAAEKADGVPVVGSARAGFVRMGVLFSIVAFLLLTIVGITRYVQEHSGGEAGDGYLSEGSAEQQEVIESCKNAYEAALKRHYEEFEGQVDHMVREKFDAAADVIPAVVARYGTIGRLSHLVKTMVVDKLSKKSDTSKEVESDLQNCFYPALYGAYDASMESCRRLQAAFESERARYLVALKSNMAGTDEGQDAAYSRIVEDSADKINAMKESFYDAQSCAALTALLEAVCVRTTTAEISRLFAKTVARLSGTIAASIGGACADGPLPVIDVLSALATLGCTVWSAHDIYVATKTVPDKLASTLHESVDKCRKSAEKAVHKRARTLFMAYIGK